MKLIWWDGGCVSSSNSMQFAHRMTSFGSFVKCIVVKQDKFPMVFPHQLVVSPLALSWFFLKWPTHLTHGCSRLKWSSFGDDLGLSNFWGTTRCYWHIVGRRVASKFLHSSKAPEANRASDACFNPVNKRFVFWNSWMVKVCYENVRKSYTVRIC